MKYRLDGLYAVPDCENPCITAGQVIYTGPNLSCTGIQTNYNLTVALQKIDEKICELFDLYYSLTTTQIP
jgi:hypothetical protein